MPGCKIIKKGEIINARYFEDKEDYFKSNAFVRKFKEDAVEWFNEELEKAEYEQRYKVYEDDGIHVATVKIKKGIKDKQVVADLEERNRLAIEWNHTVDEALAEGISEDTIKELRQSLKDTASDGVAAWKNQLRKIISDLQIMIQQFLAQKLNELCSGLHIDESVDEQNLIQSLRNAFGVVVGAITHKDAPERSEMAQKRSETLVQALEEEYPVESLEIAQNGSEDEYESFEDDWEDFEEEPEEIRHSALDNRIQETDQLRDQIQEQKLKNRHNQQIEHSHGVMKH